jgi:hypothetical protein
MKKVLVLLSALLLISTMTISMLNVKPASSAIGVVCERYDAVDGRSYVVWTSGGDICLRVEEADGSYEWHEIDVITAMRMCKMQ